MLITINVYNNKTGLCIGTYQTYQRGFYEANRAFYISKNFLPFYFKGKNKSRNSDYSLHFKREKLRLSNVPLITYNIGA